ncbi:MAG: DUF2508 family protein [Epulopiscium sp.]|nr:DUF2508 family protein [Candidatus Epulonipiscium sp.]
MNPIVATGKKGFFPFKLKIKKAYPPTEEEEIKNALRKIKNEIDLAYHRFENAMDKELVDSCIYEMKALQKKYEFYLKKAKEKDISLLKEWEQTS